MNARRVNAKIERLGGVAVRQTGSHRRFRATLTDDDGNVIATASTAVPQHPGDIATGTLRAIERDLEPIFGKGWLR